MALQKNCQVILVDDVETAYQIRKKLSTNMPLLGLVSYDSEEKKDAAERAGIGFFMNKPFFVSRFKQAVAQIFDGGESVGASLEKQSIDLIGLKVLAAEDNEINQEILLELLKMEGVECDMTSNGQEALDKFLLSSPDRYDMIFMDVHMPVMDGYAASRAIRASAHAQVQTIPIIAMTADAFDEDVKMALEAGMNAHIAKPVDMDYLRVTIDKFRKEKEEKTWI